MPHVQWHQNLSVNVPIFDQHHQKLIQIFNNLLDHMEQGKGKEVIINTVNELVKYTEYHFSEEEKFLAQKKSSDLEYQKREHSGFVKKLKEVQQKCIDHHETSAVIELSGFLKNWLINHIQRVDKNYGSLN